MLQGLVIRGTTPEHEFDLPYPREMVEDIRVTYGQGGKALFTKTINDCEISDGKIIVSLIQEETFLFAPKKQLYIEIRIKLTNGKVVRTEEPIVLRVIDSMNEEVID
jgi:hypothetical protein